MLLFLKNTKNIGYLICLNIFVFYGCKEYHNRNESANNGEKDKLASIKSNIIGKWGSGSGNPAWKITADSIYYLQQSKAYPCFFRGDTFYVKFDDRDTATAFGTIYFTGDTLRIVQYYNDNLEIRAYRH